MENKVIIPIKDFKESKKIDQELEKEIDKTNNPHIKKFAIITLILGIIIFFIVFFGIKWIYPHQTIKIPTIEYNGFEFSKIGGIWHTNWQKDGQTYTLSLRYNPEEVEDVPVFGAITETFNQKEIYLSFDPLAEPSEFKYTALASAELGLSMVKALGKQPIAACIKNETDACTDRPIVTCEDYDKSVIVISANGDPAIIMKDNCIILKGKELEILKSTDKLLYTWYSIMHPLPMPLEAFKPNITQVRENI